MTLFETKSRNAILKFFCIFENICTYFVNFHIHSTIVQPNKSFSHFQTITTLETTITEERGRFEGSGREIKMLQENISRLEVQLEEERRAKDGLDKEIVNITRQIEVLMREKQQWESESVHLKQQYQSDLDALTQVTKNTYVRPML